MHHLVELLMEKLAKVNDANILNAIRFELYLFERDFGNDEFEIIDMVRLSNLLMHNKNAEMRFVEVLSFIKNIQSNY